MDIVLLAICLSVSMTLNLQMLARNNEKYSDENLLSVKGVFFFPRVHFLTSNALFRPFFDVSYPDERRREELRRDELRVFNYLPNCKIRRQSKYSLVTLSCRQSIRRDRNHKIMK